MTRIFILTYCKKIESLYGNLLTLKTVRTGFKDAEIIVYDNNSIDEARKEIKLAATAIGAKYIQYTTDVTHPAFIKHQIEKNQDCSRVIFLDPDLVFWDSFDDFSSDALIVGRKIPNCYDSVNKAKIFEKLHTSFLIFNNPKKLVQRITELQQIHTDVILYRPYCFLLNDEWYMFDAVGTLYSIFKQECDSFTEKELSKYDHLFCGTHLDFIMKHDPSHELIHIHELVKKDINNIKGLWRKQEEFFLKNKF